MKTNFLRITMSLVAVILLSLSFTSCTDDDDDDDDDDNGATETTINVTADIAEDMTWEDGKVYILGGRITVLSGATLTIEPGVIVKGEAGTGPNATALLVARDAKIMAEGTADKPIIFTSIADEIEPGQIESPNLDPDLNGLWGGVLILGNAPISADTESVQIEGIPASDQNGLYGGTVADDNSGVFKYVSIRHGGANIGEGNEINGLTLGGVGSGTTIEYVEIVSNQDDGIEWFGGTVNVSNAIVWNTGDDAVDTDQGWAGTLDNFIVINPGDEGMELDGGEGDFNNTFTLQNGNIQAEDADGLADLDDKTTDAGDFDPISSTDCNINNVYFFEMTYGQDFDDNPQTLTASALETTLPADTLAVTDFFKKGTDAYVTSVASGSVGADKTKFNAWSWAALAGAIK